MWLLLCGLLWAGGTVKPGPVIQDPDEGLTCVQLRVDIDSGLLQDLEVDGRTIKSFRDNLGADLKGGVPPSKWVRNLEILNDGKAAVLEICTTREPMRGAKGVKVEGELTFITALGTEKTRDIIIMQAGASGILGEHPYQVRGVNPDREKPTKTVSIRVSGPDYRASGYQEVTWFADGVQVPEHLTGFLYRKDGFSFRIQVPREAETLEVELSYFDGYEKLKLPYKVEEGF